jgi:tRNA A-37 threonylcarbamoyl transferase component Bud32
LRQIEDLYHSAREREANQRSAFLSDACRGDEELQREVESLLAQDASDSVGPLGDLALGLPASLADDSTMTVLSRGTQLGPYQILGSLGVGGMGQVYKAHDSRLQRDVAIKIVFERFSGRFHREALAIAALNHPNICTLYDVGPNYLVMELVEGETLSAFLQRGSLAMDQLLRFGVQIAAALTAAHAKGIVHRDLKPGNVMLAKNGAKVLDFGLAKSVQDRTMTATNMVIGTPAYMAPEQMAGKETDARTDIYALGLVLYEMATGTRAVPGQIPPMEKLPERVGHVIERCLALDPDERWQTASDVGRELEWARKPAPVAAIPVHALPRRQWLAGSIAAASFVLGALVVLLVRSREAPVAAAATTRFQVSLPPSASYNPLIGVSPDGRLLAYVAGTESMIWVRPLDKLEAYPLMGTQVTGLQPFFWVGHLK